MPQCWPPGLCDGWPTAGFVIKVPQSSFSRCPPIISSPSTVCMTSSQIPRCTLASLHISQFLNSHLTQLRFMYLCDPTGDPWMVILSQTRIEYGLWLTSQHTSGDPVFYCALYICYAAECGAGRQRCTVSPLSHLLSPLFIDPNHTGGIYLCIVWVFVCMFNICVCR